MSYYLKYRPQTVKDLDLKDSREALQKVLKSGEFSHAYLFSGPKGTGKTSSARILAKVLNCEKNKKALSAKKAESLSEPCNECEQCKSITAGSSLSVIEMDAASNRGIDDIRTLRERIGLAPAQGSFSVYVIDEVHMLTTEAFNALLKTLEEPPEHAVFVLATTEPHKLPDTVISRCTRIQFRKAKNDEVVHSLEKVKKGEKLKLEKGVLEKIADRVDGSFRDGMKILEQVSQQDGEVTLKDIDQLTGFSDEYDPTEFIQALAGFDAEKALEDLDKRSQLGVDFTVFSKRIVEELRIHLIQTVKGKEAELHKEEWLSLLDIFTKAALQMKSTLIPQLPLEMAVVAWVADDSASSGGSTGSTSKNPAPAEKTQKNIAQPTKKVVAEKKVEVVKKQTSAPHMEEPQEVEPQKEEIKRPALNGRLDTNTFKKEWPHIIEAVGKENTSLTALLKAARPVKAEEDSLLLSVSYSFHKEQLEQDRHRNVLEQIIANVTNTQVRLLFEVGKKEAVDHTNPPTVANITGSVEDEELAQAAEEIFG